MLINHFDGFYDGKQFPCTIIGRVERYAAAIVIQLDVGFDDNMPLTSKPLLLVETIISVTNFAKT